MSTQQATEPIDALRCRGDAGRPVVVSRRASPELPTRKVWLIETKWCVKMYRSTVVVPPGGVSRELDKGPSINDKHYSARRTTGAELSKSGKSTAIDRLQF